LWQRAIHGDNKENIAKHLAKHHRHSSGRIAQLGQMAHHYRSLAGREEAHLDDIIQASREGDGVGLDALAQPLRSFIPEDALVVSEQVTTQMQLLTMRCQARDGLANQLGVSASVRYRPGVRALLAGPSGTGKTLAALWLSSRLGLPLYRVDLASVTSKYIGETEKNLAQLLARAEQAEVVLLFDEADSMFGKRTEVKEANDRFANAQTNYLLQRLETYDGITLLTSNNRNRLDSAFTRRLDMIIEFDLPAPNERLRLWHSHLGESHGVSRSQLNKLAAVAELTGGHIRNAVLTAAAISQTEQRAITYDDILRGLDIEYRKQGKKLPHNLSR
jgi:ATP-dependent Clp protease ATP-binding subunit ClpA